MAEPADIEEDEDEGAQSVRQSARRHGWQLLPIWLHC